MNLPIIARPDLDEAELCKRRQQHLQTTMIDDGIELLVLTNPISIRYATGYRGYSSFQSKIPSAYLLLPAAGPVVLHGAYTDALDTIDRCESAHSVTTFDAGLDQRRAIDRFSTDIAQALAASGCEPSATVGIERTTPLAHRVLAGGDFRVVDGEPVVELARSRKIDGELVAMCHAIRTAEAAMQAMHDQLRPGITENELWSTLHAINIANDGDGVDGRMLCSGPRTNPWYQEASDRPIRAQDLVAFDTDMIGPFGYCADISRTWAVGDAPTPEQYDLHARAIAEIEHNTALLRPGASFAELSQQSFAQPDRFVANRYACVFHGVGMSDEYPKIPYPQDWEWTGYDGEIEAGMVLSVESYVGADAGRQGVKLEQMVQVTPEGAIALSTFPLDLA